MPENLMDGLLSEIDRVKEIVKMYEDPELGGAGKIAAFLMKKSIVDARNSILNNDIVEMVRSYNNLKEYEC